MMVLKPVHFALVFSQLEGNHLFLHLVSGSDVKAQPAPAQGVKLQFNLLPVWFFSTISFVWWRWCDGEGIDNDMHIYADDEKMLSASGGWVCIEQLCEAADDVNILRHTLPPPILIFVTTLPTMVVVMVMVVMAMMTK